MKSLKERQISSSLRDHYLKWIL